MTLGEIPYFCHTIVVTLYSSTYPYHFYIATKILVRYLYTWCVRYLDPYHDETEFRGVREIADIPRSSPRIASKSRLLVVPTRSFEGLSFRVQRPHNLRSSNISMIWA